MATFVSSSVFAKIPKKTEPSSEQAQKESEEKKQIEEKLREEYRQKLEAEKQKAKQEAERKIEEEKQRQRMILEARKQAEIAKWIWQSRIGLREKLKQEEAQAKEKFQAQLEREKQVKKREFERKLSLEAYRLLRAGVKRQKVEEWKRQQKAEFLQQLQAWEQRQKSQFEQQITTGKKEAIQQFETKLQEKLPEVEQNLTKQIESTLSAWEESAKQQLELSIEEWEKQAWQKFETELLPQLKKIKQTGQPTISDDEIIRRIMPMLPPVIGGKLAFEASKGSKPAAAILKSFEERQVLRAKAILSGFTPLYPSPTSVTIESALTWSTKPFQKFASDPEYAILSTASEILGYITFSKALSWAGGKVGGWIKQTETFQKLARTIKFSRAYKFYYERFKVPVKSWYTTKVKMPAEKWMIKHWRWYQSRIGKTLAPELADIPEFSYPTPTALFRQEVAWRIAESPKSTALLITKYTGRTEKMLPDWVSEHWIKKVTVTGGATQLLSPEQTVKPVVEPLTKIFIPSIQSTTKKTASLLKPLIGAFVIKATFKPRILQELTPSLKAIETEIAKIENLTRQFSIPKISIKLITEAFVSPGIKFRTSTILGKLSIPEMKAPSIPKFKIPSGPFKIKSKRKKGKLSPLLYGWGWMISPVMEPPEVMKLMLGGGRKK